MVKAWSIPGNNSLLLRFVVLFISTYIMLCHVIMSEFFNLSGSLSILLLHLSSRAALKMQLVRADGRRGRTAHTQQLPTCNGMQPNNRFTSDYFVSTIAGSQKLVIDIEIQ